MADTHKTTKTNADMGTARFSFGKRSATEPATIVLPTLPAQPWTTREAMMAAMLGASACGMNIILK